MSKPITAEQSKQVVELHKKGEEREDIALEVGISVSTVKRVLSRAGLIYVNDAIPLSERTLLRHLRTLKINDIGSLKSYIASGKNI